MGPPPGTRLPRADRTGRCARAPHRRPKSRGSTRRLRRHGSPRRRGARRALRRRVRRDRATRGRAHQQPAGGRGRPRGAPPLRDARPSHGSRSRTTSLRKRGGWRHGHYQDPGRGASRCRGVHKKVTSYRDVLCGVVRGRHRCTALSISRDGAVRATGGSRLLGRVTGGHGGKQRGRHENAMPRALTW